VADNKSTPDTAPLSAQRIWDRCEALARHSGEPDRLTRVFLSREQNAASQLVLGWMRDAGMSARLDAIGNVVGRYEGERPGLPCLMLGSHLDTVRDAGKYDGMLGVVTAIECVHALNAGGRRLRHAVEIVGFADEEGVRFGTTLLGSRAVAGTFTPPLLDAQDAIGLTMRQALEDVGLDADAIPGAARRREELLAYAELHIEQGPVLEAAGLPVGVVTGINGFTRLRAAVKGIAGHAGTVPMRMRRDALAAAAECVLAVERIAAAEPDLVGTVGRLEALPGAINVIPGEARFTLDVRSPRDEQRRRAVAAIRSELECLCERRGASIFFEELQDSPAALCAPWLMDQLRAAIIAHGLPAQELPSGAGHDGLAMSAIADICMLFVRCEKGVSHNPAEAITLADAEIAARVLLHFIEKFAPADAQSTSATAAHGN
jgi:allantoate deiminase